MTVDEVRAAWPRTLREDVPAARKLVQQFARHADRDDDAHLRAEALRMRAELEDVTHRPARARALYQQARRAFARIGTPLERAAVEVGLVQINAELGDKARTRQALRRLEKLKLEKLARAGAAIAAGTAYETLGDARLAEKQYRTALQTIGRGRQKKAPFLRATAAANLAVCLGRRGANAEARRHAARAAETFGALDMHAPARVTRFTHAWLVGQAGDIETALAELDHCSAAFAEHNEHRWSGLARLDHAELLLRMGDFDATATGAAEAARSLKRAGFAPDAARAQLLAARAHHAAGRRGRARQIARRAQTTLRQAGDRAGSAHAAVLTGDATARATRTLREQGHFVAALDALVAQARLARPAAGARLLADESRTFPVALRRWVQPELWALRARGEPERRIAHLRRAVAHSESLRELAPIPRWRATTLAAHLSHYESLATALLARGRAVDRREAFWVLDAARARTLHDEMERVAPGLGKTGRVRKLRKQLETLWRAVEREEGRRDNLRSVAPQLYAEVASAEHELLAAMETETSRGSAPAIKERPALRHPCLALAVLDARVVAMLANGNSVQTWDAGALQPWRDDLAAFSFQVVRRLHGATDHDAADGLLQTMAARLFDKAPVWPESTSLDVVLPAELGSIPVAALPYEDVPLLERCAITLAPRAGAVHQQWRRDNAPLIVGSADERLPEVAREIHHVAREFTHAELLSDQDAARDDILEKLGGRSLIHLAGHARARHDAPSLSALRVGDGWLTAADLADARLQRSLVVLSACRTGDPALRWYGESLAGFPRALLAAGAATIVGSRWDVSDTSAASFMRYFYTALKKQEPAAACRTAALQLRRSQRHPADWAAFLCVHRGVL